MRSLGEDTNVLIVGASLAGVRAVQGLRAEGFPGSIVVIGEEPHVPYDRPPLSKEILTGDRNHDTLELLSKEEQQDPGLELRLGERATSLDIGERKVYVGKDAHPYDYLVIATGSRARELPRSKRMSGIHTIRTKEDSEAVRHAMDSGPRLVVIGFGFIGCEVAASARKLGLDVTIIDTASQPYAQFDTQFASRLVALHRDHGVKIRLSRRVTRFMGTSRVEAVELDDGTVLPADLVVVGVGSQPNHEWVEGSGLYISDGVETDSTLLAAPGVFAAGDITSWPNQIFGRRMRIEHWTNASEQGRLVARNIVNYEQRHPYRGIPYFWSDQHGCRIQFMGDLTAFDSTMWFRKAGDEVTAVGIFGKGGGIVGIAGINSIRFVMTIRRLIQSKTSWQTAVDFLKKAAEESGYIAAADIDVSVPS